MGPAENSSCCMASLNIHGAQSGGEIARREFSIRLCIQLNVDVNGDLTRLSKNIK